MSNADERLQPLPAGTVARRAREWPAFIVDYALIQDRRIRLAEGLAMKAILTLLLGVALAVNAPRVVYADEDSRASTCPGANRALVISGGGVRGAFQVGALWYLVHELGCEFSRFVGTSTGRSRQLFWLKALTRKI